MDTDIKKRLFEFKNALSEKSTDYIVRRYTTFGRPYVIDEDFYFDLKSEIGDHFRIHPSEIVMVGSAKLGFSIKSGKRRFQPFGENSDIDIAIISPNLFDRIWLETLIYSESKDIWEKKEKFQEYLFQGWIRPDMLPPYKSSTTRREWWDFFTKLTQKYDTYTIRGGLYKSWYHFELYQSRAVNSCKRNLGGDIS